MREIIFRAYDNTSVDKEFHRMVYLNDMPYDCDLMIGDNGELHLFSCYTHSDTFGYEHDDWVKIDNVMQYTGLCDKNDTKIFMKCIEFATKRG